MHELSVAAALARTLQEYRREHRVRVTAAHVKVGRLSGIDPEALRFAWEPALAGEPGLEGCRLEIAWNGLRHRCRACGLETVLEDWSVTCPRCGKEELRREGGSEFLLESIEVENV